MLSDSSKRAPEGQEGPRWYAVQTRPRKERLALQHLSNQDFTTYCPWRRRLRKVGRHNVAGLDPFFPGYVFARVDLERDRWRSINGTIGVLRVVGFGDRAAARPSPLPHGLVERFQELSGSTGDLRFRESLSKGDHVRVVGGPFDQLCGILESAGDAERVTILLAILSKQTRVSLDRNMLVPA